MVQLWLYIHHGSTVSAAFPTYISPPAHPVPQFTGELCACHSGSHSFPLVDHGLNHSLAFMVNCMLVVANHTATGESGVYLPSGGSLMSWWIMCLLQWSAKPQVNWCFKSLTNVMVNHSCNGELLSALWWIHCNIFSSPHEGSIRKFGSQAIKENRRVFSVGFPCRHRQIAPIDLHPRKILFWI